MVNNWLNIIQDSLLPPSCILCGNAGFNSQDICQPCFNDLPKNIHYCYRCAKTFATVNPVSQLCGECISHSCVLDKTEAPFIYQSTIAYLIGRLKFQKQYKNARLLAYLLAKYLTQTTEMPTAIIPVPLHKIRYRERGFNQSLEIAKNLSKRLKIPVDTKSCVRNRHTPHQFNLSAKQRHKNVSNAFSVKQAINAQHIAILDDVMTTGSTVKELAKAIKKSGVNQVDVWVCARAQL